jgi:hypothetical protein
MSRVLAVPSSGGAGAPLTSLMDGALTRAQKELIATMVSAINVCEY